MGRDYRNRFGQSPLLSRPPVEFESFMPPPASSMHGQVQGVLAIGALAVEWYERAPAGTVRHARVEVSDSNTETLVHAAEEAWLAAEGTTRNCVLAFARPHASHKLLSLPPLGRGDLGAVLHRRSQALAGTPAIYYVAREQERPRATRAPDELRSWLLAVLDEGARPLRAELRERGFRVKRVVSSDLAALEWARQGVEDHGKVGLAIVVSESSASVALVEGGRLIYQESIDGDLAARPALVSGLVHEIRTCAAFWRKVSRGQALEQVVVAGLPRARVEPLAVTLSSILPGATVQALGAAGNGAEGRQALLEAALVRGPLNAELTFWLPQGRRLIGLTSLLGSVVIAALTFFGFDAGNERVRDLREETLIRRRGTADLEDLLEREERAALAMDEVRSYVERCRDMAAHGVPLEPTLATVLAAFAGQGELESVLLRVDADDRIRMAIQGRCPSDPLGLVERLNAILGRMKRDPALREFELSLPEALDSARRDMAGFSIEAVVGA